MRFPPLQTVLAAIAGILAVAPSADAAGVGLSREETAALKAAAQSQVVQPLMDAPCRGNGDLPVRRTTCRAHFRITLAHKTSPLDAADQAGGVLARRVAHISFREWRTQSWFDNEEDDNFVLTDAGWRKTSF